MINPLLKMSRWRRLRTGVQPIGILPRIGWGLPR